MGRERWREKSERKLIDKVEGLGKTTTTTIMQNKFSLVLP